MASMTEHQLRATINQKLIESGEKERLKEMLRTQLVQCGWKDDMKAHCRELISAKGVENVNVEDLVAEITPKGRAEVPASVKAELLQRIRATLSKEFDWSMLHQSWAQNKYVDDSGRTSVVRKLRTRLAVRCINEYRRFAEMKRDIEDVGPKEGEGSDAHGYDELSPENLAKLEAFLARHDPPEDSDSSEDDDINTIGRSIPLKWYENYDHIGYDLEGKPLMKGEIQDSLDRLLETENPNFWRTIRDQYNNREMIISDKDLALIRKLKKSEYIPGVDPFPETVEVDDPLDKLHPLSNRREPKRRFIPSKWEAQRIAKIVRAIREGWIDLEKKEEVEEQPKQFYLIWDAPSDEQVKHITRPLPPPKVELPGHRESYRPPEEYLLDEDEELAWHDADPKDRSLDFLPCRYESMREVPIYDRAVQDRLDRCFDLFLVPRKAVKPRKLQTAEELLPQLPSREDLRPFPVANVLTFEGHKGEVLAVSPSPDGRYLASGGADGTLRVWEVATGRCVDLWQMEEAVQGVAWCPNPSVCLIVAATGRHLVFVEAGVCGEEVALATAAMLDPASLPAAPTARKGTVLAAEWEDLTDPAAAERVTRLPSADKRIRLGVQLLHRVRQVRWHARGDYLATLAGRGRRACLIHQLQSKRSQAPFKRNQGDAQAVSFHPKKPFFFLATRTDVLVYDLVKQVKVKKLTSTSNWISSIDIHPDGDNVIVGGHDQKFCWFDMDLSTTPYKNLKYHREAIRDVAFHSRLPLFASCSDDGSIYVFHGMVYDDLLQNALLVPLKQLRGHKLVEGAGVTRLSFHSSHPWIISAGADGTIRLWTN